MTTDKHPTVPLPERLCIDDDKAAYSEDQMRKHGAACAAAALTAKQATPTIPVDIYGKLYEVPIAVQVHIVNLHERLAAALEAKPAAVHFHGTLNGAPVDTNSDTYCRLNSAKPAAVPEEIITAMTDAYMLLTRLGPVPDHQYHIICNLSAAIAASKGNT
jgi:hypothetical protein